MGCSEGSEAGSKAAGGAMTACLRWLLECLQLEISGAHRVCGARIPRHRLAPLPGLGIDRLRNKTVLRFPSGRLARAGSGDTFAVLTLGCIIEI